MRSDLPSGTVTFLFTDVEGSTRLLHELGAEAYAQALAEHRRVIREACIRHEGVEVDTQGDAFFFAFPTAPGALSAAGDMTEALAPGAIEVRAGMHTGTPLLTDEGFVGPDVHRAARIAAAGHGGQVLVSSSTAQLVEIELADLGEHRLKDLGAPERIYQVRAKVLARRGEHAEAERLAHEAVAIGEDTDMLDTQGDAYADLAEALLLTGKPNEAAAALEQALERYGRKGNRVSAQRAQTRLAELRDAAPS